MKRMIAILTATCIALGVGSSALVMGQEDPATKPLPQFNFLVQIPGVDTAGFEEVSGLGCETEIVDYREGNTRDTTASEFAGLTECGPVTLEKGLTTDNALWEWYALTKNGDPDKRNVQVQVLDRERNAQVHVSLVNAWPAAYEVGELDADASGIAVERLVLAVEDLDFQAAAE